MFDQILQYLDTAPIAVVLIIYIWFSDRAKAKMMEGYKSIIEKDKETTEKLIDLIEELTRKT